MHSDGEASQLKHLVGLLTVDDAGPITYIQSPVVDFLGLKEEMRRHGISVVWIDRLRPINREQDVYDAFDTAFGYFFARPIDVNVLRDALLISDYLPESGCLLYSTEMRSLKTGNPDLFEVLVEILEEVSVSWQRNSYYFRSLLVE